MSDKIFYREKGTKRWFAGWIVHREGQMIQIGSYNGAHDGVWYELRDIDIKERP